MTFCGTVMVVVLRVGVVAFVVLFFVGGVVVGGMVIGRMVIVVVVLKAHFVIMIGTMDGATLRVLIVVMVVVVVVFVFLLGGRTTLEISRSCFSVPGLVTLPTDRAFLHV